MNKQAESRVYANQIGKQGSATVLLFILSTPLTKHSVDALKGMEERAIQLTFPVSDEIENRTVSFSTLSNIVFL